MESSTATNNKTDHERTQFSDENNRATDVDEYFNDRFKNLSILDGTTHMPDVPSTSRQKSFKLSIGGSTHSYSMQEISIMKLQMEFRNNIINTFSTDLLKKSKNTGHLATIDTYNTTSILEGNYESVLENINLKDKRRIIFIVNDNNHFYCIVADLPFFCTTYKSALTILDPCKLCNININLGNIRCFLTAEFQKRNPEFPNIIMGIDKLPESFVEVPQQNNVQNSGLYVLSMIENIINNSRMDLKKIAWDKPEDVELKREKYTDFMMKSLQ